MLDIFFKIEFICSMWFLDVFCHAWTLYTNPHGKQRILLLVQEIQIQNGQVIK